MPDNYISKIVVDLSAWSDHYPTGCIMYHYDTEVDSQCCDSVEEYIDYIDRFKDKLMRNITSVQFVFEGFDLEDGAVFDCAREIWEHVHNLIYGRAN